jgi:hypothetical protein
MKPLKSGLTFANWLMRISIAIFLAVTFMGDLKTFEYTDKVFYINSSFVLFGLLIFIGGFLSKPAITVISGFILTGLSIYKIVVQFSGGINSTISTMFVVLAIGFYFACAGNQQ